MLMFLGHPKFLTYISKSWSPSNMWQNLVMIGLANNKHLFCTSWIKWIYHLITNCAVACIKTVFKNFNFVFF